VSVIGYRIIKIKYLCANDGLSAPAVSTNGRWAMQGSELDGASEIGAQRGDNVRQFVYYFRN
jgi:hypothetical protein